MALHGDRLGLEQMGTGDRPVRVHTAQHGSVAGLQVSSCVPRGCVFMMCYLKRKLLASLSSMTSVRSGWPGPWPPSGDAPSGLGPWLLPGNQGCLWSPAWESRPRAVRPASSLLGARTGARVPGQLLPRTRDRRNGRGAQRAPSPAVASQSPGRVGGCLPLTGAERSDTRAVLLGTSSLGRAGQAVLPSASRVEGAGV